RTSGSQSASTSFALAAGNTNPQGIADPPVPIDTETLVNQTTAGVQGSASTSTGKDQTYAAAADASGNFVVVWTHADGSNPVDVRARLFFADGTARTGEITVGTTPTGDFVSGAQNTPVVAMED